MAIDLQDTITAIASPPGPADRGIVRVSGPDTQAIVQQLFASDDSEQAWKSTRLPHRWPGSLTLPDFCRSLPCHLLFWPTTRSYTGQIMAELHLIGSTPVLEAVTESLCQAGARLAGRGEFTLRAFLSGRIDLLQAEAVNEVIHATDHEELQTALSQLGGGITSRLLQLRADLVALIGDLEAGLDFVDEDIEFISAEEVGLRIQRAVSLVSSLAKDSAESHPAGYRRRVVLAGQPNAGKSTLFNRLAGEELAVITEVPGTTRDFVSTVIKRHRTEFELIDTAGLEEFRDQIEQQSQMFRQQQSATADLLIWCRSAALSESEQRADESLRRQCLRPNQNCFTVITQCDRSEATLTPSEAGDTLQISAVTGEGTQQFEQQLISILRDRGQARSELLATSSVRCRESLRQALQALETAGAACSQQLGDELISLELRTALRQLQSILGEIYTDDLLDHIFSNFCIGK